MSGSQGASGTKRFACPEGCPLRRAGGPVLVTIPLEDYEELLRAKVESDQKTLSLRQFRVPARNSVERDPEITVFITQKLGLMPVREIVRQTRRRFGKARTPSPQAIYRYWDKMRSQTHIQGPEGREIGA